MRPRLAVIHHATVNDASREQLISDVRAEYPEGACPSSCLPEFLTLAALQQVHTASLRADALEPALCARASVTALHTSLVV